MAIDELTGLELTDTPVTNTALDKEKENLLRDLFGAGANSLFRRQMRAAGQYLPSELNYNSCFYRVQRLDPYYRIYPGIEYLFFTKPDLNILGPDKQLTKHVFQDNSFLGLSDRAVFGGTEYISYFKMLMQNGYQRTLSDLCASVHLFDNCPFIRILSNRKRSNLDLPDITTQELETAQNMFGTKLHYPTTSMKSDEDFEFTIEFEETQYLEIYHLFKAWDMYRQMKYLGLVMPTQEHIFNKILSDHISIYKFIVDEDGEEIIYWAKLTGVYPKSISRSAFSEIKESGGVSINVNFKLSGWIEDMDPYIIEDFNELIRNWISGVNSSFNPKYMPIYDEELQVVSGENIPYFYIELEPSFVKKVQDGSTNTSGYGRYYLKSGTF